MLPLGSINSNLQLNTANHNVANNNAVNNNGFQGNQQDFLKLLLWQMQNQDPLEPKDGSELFNQLVQIHNVKSTQESSDKISEMTKELKEIKTIVKDFMSHKTQEIPTHIINLRTNNGVSEVVEGYLNMPMINGRNIREANIQIINPSNNRLLQTISLGSRRPGEKVNFTWNGNDLQTGRRLLDDRRRPIADGQYRIVGKAVVENRNYDLTPIIIKRDIKNRR